MTELTSKTIIWTSEGIAKYLGTSRSKFYALVKMGLPAAIVQGTWCAHTENLEEFFKTITLSNPISMNRKD